MVKFKFLGIEWNFLPIAQLLVLIYFCMLIGLTFFLPEMDWIGISIYVVLIVLTSAAFKSIDKFMKRV